VDPAGGRPARLGPVGLCLYRQKGNLPPVHSLLALALVVAQAQTAPVHPADRLRLLDAQVEADLLANDMDALLARGQVKPATVDDAIKRLTLCLRAGRRAEAAAVIDHLGELRIDLDLTRALLGFLVGNRREIDLAARLIERVPGSGREFESNIVGHWLNIDRKPRQDVDLWLADRGWSDNRPRVDSDNRPRVDDVRLDTEPGTASEAFERGMRAAWMNMHAQAAMFLEKALAMPFTPDELQRDGLATASLPMSDAEWERRFRARMRVELAGVYRSAGDEERAQTVLRQAAGEDPSILKDLDFAEVAGQAQSASGARQIEQEIRARETEAGNSPDYWMARARYFAARKEEADTRDAYERALRIARAEPPGRGYARHVLRQYVEHLASTDARPEAWRLLKRELASGWSANDWMLDELAQLLDDEKELRFDTEWVWKELERRADWEPAMHLLEQLVESERWDERSPVVSRALALVSESDRGRVLPLARALHRANQGAAAVPLFKRALAEAPGPVDASLEKEVLEATRDALHQQFNAEIAQDDWRRAEQTWAELHQLATSTGAGTLNSTASVHVQLAVAAARRDDRADALRFWRAAANLDRTEGLGQLGSFPLNRYRDELREFYTRMADRDPASWVPATALKHLSQ
jgi:hypothetical protein